MSRSKLFPFSTYQGTAHSSVKETFREIYEKRLWLINNSESVSGEGSSLEQTQVLRQNLPLLLRELNIRSILDIPCGDFNWMQHVELGEIQYLGADIVPALIEQNQMKFADENHTFLHLDLLTDELPACDLIFCRDCLVHFSFGHIRQAIQQVKRSKANFFATTHFLNEPKNQDIKTGGWRPLNFLQPPFCFPPPVKIILEECTEAGGVFSDKSLAIWKVNDLPDLYSL